MVPLFSIRWVSWKGVILQGPSHNNTQNTVGKTSPLQRSGPTLGTVQRVSCFIIRPFTAVPWILFFLFFFIRLEFFAPFAKTAQLRCFGRPFWAFFRAPPSPPSGPILTPIGMSVPLVLMIMATLSLTPSDSASMDSYLGAASMKLTLSNVVVQLSSTSVLMEVGEGKQWGVDRLRVQQRDVRGQKKDQEGVEGATQHMWKGVVGGHQQTRERSRKQLLKEKK